MNTRSRRWLTIFAAIFFATLLLSIAYVSWASIRALRTSHTLVMGRIATRLTTQYVAEHQGRWPQSWADLDEVHDRSPAVQLEPGHPISNTLRTVVVIDFTANPAELARQDVATFRAIRPINDPGGGYREYWAFAELLEELRKHHSQ